MKKSKYETPQTEKVIVECSKYIMAGSHVYDVDDDEPVIQRAPRRDVGPFAND